MIALDELCGFLIKKNGLKITTTDCNPLFHIKYGDEVGLRKHLSECENVNTVYLTPEYW